MSYGPFTSACTAENRQRYLIELRALVRVFAGPAASEASTALGHAVHAPDDEARLDAARRAIDALPSRPRRRVLATFAALRREVMHD